MKKYKIEFQFSTSYDPTVWDWPSILVNMSNMLKTAEAGSDVDYDSVKLFAQDWNLIVKGA